MIVTSNRYFRDHEKDPLLIVLLISSWIKVLGFIS